MMDGPPDASLDDHLPVGTASAAAEALQAVPVGFLPAEPAPAEPVPAEALSAESVLGQVLAFLLPFFLKGAAGDAGAARAAALQLLESYDATSGKDLLLAAQIVAFSFSSLDALGKAVAEPELSASARLRQRGNANALHRAGEQCRKALDRSHHPRAP